MTIREHHCRLVLLAKDEGVEVVYLPEAPGTPHAGWYVEKAVSGDFRMRIWHCPFCGVDLLKESPPLCGEPGPLGKLCNRDKGHDGMHCIGWEGTVEIPGFRKESAPPPPKICDFRGPWQIQCERPAGHDGWHRMSGMDWQKTDGRGPEGKAT